MRTAFSYSTHVLMAAMFVVGVSIARPVALADENAVEQGRKVAVDRRAGNCLACHMMGDGESPGNLAPPLVAMKARFPDRQRLRDIIWDITASRPEVSMPPFGRHQILSEQEIDNIVEYLYTL